MTDHPIPDDLLDALAAHAWDEFDASAHNKHDYYAWCAICRGDLPRILSVLSEWADGALIDPDGWRRVKAEPKGWDWCSTANKPLPTRANVDPCGDDHPLFVLTPAPEEET